MKGGLIETGIVETYAVNNIYDMAGNVSELTIEVFRSNNARTERGGGYYYVNPLPVSYREFSNISSSSISKNEGSRVALYM